jgi:hypothetical protein
MQKPSLYKFNYKKAVNNRYKPSKSCTHNVGLILHNISKEHESYIRYYADPCILSIMQQMSVLDTADLLDYERYERWLGDGGRY